MKSLKAVSSSGMMWSSATKAALLAHAPDAVLIDFLNSHAELGGELRMRPTAPGGPVIRHGGGRCADQLFGGIATGNFTKQGTAEPVD